MKKSVALLIAARGELAVHDDDDVIVTNLCRTFGVGADDALAAVIAARLLADQPGRADPFRIVEAIAVEPRFVADQTA